MAMNQWIAQMYNTNKVAERTKEASAQEAAITQLRHEFVKQATVAGVDLEQMSSDDLNTAFTAFVHETAAGEKTAEAAPQAPSQQETLLKQAQAEFEQVKQAQQQLQELDYAGRIIAHAIVDELGAIQKHAAEESEKKDEDKVDESEKKDSSPMPPMFGKKDEEKKDEEGSEKDASFGAAAIDQIAYQIIPSLLEKTAFDGNAVQRRVALKAELGELPGRDLSKTAHVKDFDMAVQERALQMVAAVGVPVNWDAFYAE